MIILCLLYVPLALSTPTEEGKHLPTPPARRESLKVRHSANSTPDSSPSPPLCKKPVPLPRKKLPQSKTIQVLSPILSRSPCRAGIVHSQQESEEGSASAVVHLLPHRGKASCSSGDYSSSAGDSGYGGDTPKYVPSQEALERELVQL